MGRSASDLHLPMEKPLAELEGRPAWSALGIELIVGKIETKLTRIYPARFFASTLPVFELDDEAAFRMCS